MENLNLKQSKLPNQTFVKQSTGILIKEYIYEIYLQVSFLYKASCTILKRFKSFHKFVLKFAVLSRNLLYVKIVEKIRSSILNVKRRAIRANANLSRRLVNNQIRLCSRYDVWAFAFVPDRNWRRLNGTVSKVSDWGGRTRSDSTMWSGDAGICNVSKRNAVLSVHYRYISGINNGAGEHPLVCIRDYMSDLSGEFVLA